MKRRKVVDKGLLCYFPDLDTFLANKISNDPRNTSYIYDEIVFFSKGANVKWEQIAFIKKEGLIWTHGAFYGEKDDLSNFLNKDDYEALRKIMENNYIHKNTLATINGKSLEDGGNIEITYPTVIEIVKTLPTSDISTNKIYIVPETKTDNETEFGEYIWADGKWDKVGVYKKIIDLSDYLTKSLAESLYLQRYNKTARLSLSPNGSLNNYGDNGQAFNAVRDLTDYPYGDLWDTEVGSGYELNSAAFGVKDTGTTAFTHKKYDTFDKMTGNYTGAYNTAVLSFSGASGLLYAKNTGTSPNVTQAMYKLVGVIDSPDEKQRVYSAAQVDALLKTLTDRIAALENQLANK